jgi:hypothetical protein
MEDRLSKFLRLFGNVMLLAIVLILLPFLILLLLRLLMSSLDSISWFSYVYIVFMLLLPFAVFVSVYLIFFKKTKFHPVKTVRLFSNVVFFIATISWVMVLIWDFITFIKKGYTDIDKYNSYNLLYVASNGFAIFLTGIIQALTTEKEKDWFDKYR